jgi:hypothetical protein
MLEVVTLDRFHEKRGLDLVAAEGVEHEAQAFRTPVDVAPYIRLGHRDARCVAKGATNAEFGVDGDTNPGAHGVNLISGD